MAEVPVTADVIKYIRQYHDLTLAKAAELLKIHPDRLQRIESGAELPTKTIFRKMRDVYKLPEALLLRKTRPKFAKKPTDFRVLGGNEPRISLEILKVVRKVRNMLELMSDISEDIPDVASYTIPRITRRANPDEEGLRFREHCGITHSSQLAWGDPKTAFDDLRRCIEDQGIYVFLEGWPVEDCRGFTLFDSGSPPAIVISKEENYKLAWVFTLIHEYCHLLLNRPGIDDETDGESNLERFCNRFAASFLVPESLLAKVLPKTENEPKDWDADELRDASQALSVSQSVVALRLEELGRAPDGFFGRFLARFDYTEELPVRPKRKEGQSRGFQPQSRQYEVGPRYKSNVFLALQKGVIDRFVATEMLGIKSEFFHAIGGGF